MDTFEIELLRKKEYYKGFFDGKRDFLLRDEIFIGNKISKMNVGSPYEFGYKDSTEYFSTIYAGMDRNVVTYEYSKSGHQDTKIIGGLYNRRYKKDDSESIGKDSKEKRLEYCKGNYRGY